MKHNTWPAGRWRYLAVASLLAVFTIAVYAAVMRNAGRVADVVIQIQPSPDGLFLIQASDVRSRLDAGPQGVLIGQAIDGIVLEQLERFLRTDPYVASADIYSSFDGKLHVELTQKQPILRVHDRTGVDYYIGPSGEILPLSKHDVARVPILTGSVPTFAEAVQDSLLPAAYPLASELRGDALLGALIEQIDYRDGAYTLIPKLGTAEFRLGSLAELPAKLERLRTYLYGATPEVGWEAYSSVDLRYAGQVVCQRKGSDGV